MKKRIHDWSLGYFLLKLYTKLSIKLFYSEIHINGYNKIPNNRPVILAPNHQNALMDALNILLHIPYQPVFMARADIFKNRLIANILTFLKIIPAYRLRDGYSSLFKNKDSFDQALEVLKDRKILCIMPEGTQNNIKQLKPLVKGTFRIALKAQEEMGNNPFVLIIPVGIDYSHYWNFRSKVVVNFGNPIEVSSLYDIYKGNPALAFNILKNKLSDELKKIMLHIHDSKNYQTIYGLSEIVSKGIYENPNQIKTNYQDLFNYKKLLIDQLNQTSIEQQDLLELAEVKVQYFYKYLSKTKLRPWILEADRYHFTILTGISIVTILFIPLFIYGYINNLLAYHLPLFLANKIEDKQFQSSVKFTVGMILAPVIYLIQTFIVGYITGSIWISILYFVTLPLFGIFSFDYYIFLKKLISMWRYNILFFSRDRNLSQLIQERAELFNITREILNQNKTRNHGI